MVFIFPCWIYLFVQLGVMICANMFLALAFTLFFLVPLLMICGPNKKFGEVADVILCRPCRRRVGLPVGRDMDMFETEGGQDGGDSLAHAPYGEGAGLGLGEGSLQAPETNAPRHGAGLDECFFGETEEGRTP